MLEKKATPPANTVRQINPLQSDRAAFNRLIVFVRPPDMMKSQLQD